MVGNGQEPVFQVDLLIEVSSALLVVVEFCAGVTNSDREIVVLEEFLVEGAHHSLGGADGDGVAHRQHKLHPGLHQAAAQAGFALADLHTGLTGIQDSNGYMMFEQQVRQFRGFDEV